MVSGVRLVRWGAYSPPIIGQPSFRPAKAIGQESDKPQISFGFAHVSSDKVSDKRRTRAENCPTERRTGMPGTREDQTLRERPSVDTPASRQLLAVVLKAGSSSSPLPIVGCLAQQGARQGPESLFLETTEKEPRRSGALGEGCRESRARSVGTGRQPSGRGLRRAGRASPGRESAPRPRRG